MSEAVQREFEFYAADHEAAKKWSVIWCTSYGERANDAIEQAEERIRERLAKHFPEADSLVSYRIELTVVYSTVYKAREFFAVVYGNPAKLL